MATRRNTRPSGGGNLPHGIPAELPDDGTPFTIVTKTTHQKQMGNGVNETPEPTLSVDDLVDATWEVYIRTSSGFSLLDKVDGQPGAVDLQELYGPGRYKVIPQDSRGRPMEKFAQVHKIEDLEARDRELSERKKDHRDPRDWGGTIESKEDMPAWMQMMMTRDAEEKKEARRIALESAAREEQHRKEFEKREWERREREERENRERRAAEEKERRERYEREMQERAEQRRREMEDRQFRAKQQGEWAQAAATIVTGLMNRPQPQPAPSNNETTNILLQYLLKKDDKPAQPQMTLGDQVDVLLKLKNLTQEPKEEKSDFDKALEVGQNVLPAAMQYMQQRSQNKQAALMAAQGIPQHQLQPPEPQQPDVNAIGKAVLTDPSMISQIAMQDPEAVARAAAEAVNNNPALKDAFIQEFMKGQ